MTWEPARHGTPGLYQLSDGRVALGYASDDGRWGVYSSGTGGWARPPTLAAAKAAAEDEVTSHAWARAAERLGRR